MTHLIDDACCISCCAIATTVAVVKFIKSEFPDDRSKEVALPEGNFLVRRIGYYQRIISPAIKGERGIKSMCRYTPSCSEYARQSILYHGSMRGTLLAMERLARCNPFSSGGYDPVPL
ncbi:MAG: membrane protein insertion efficiency factor YidD [Candidatus Aenigmarchaeota archaeon]|nr:membrane protein insertion efficiency factor YidD [Candidatus Aenigmarchaeota archaeon]